MEDKDLWTTFEKTGSVVDYLNYKGIHAGTGEDKFESVSNSDRDDTVRNTNW